MTTAQTSPTRPQTPTTESSTVPGARRRAPAKKAATAETPRRSRRSSTPTEPAEAAPSETTPPETTPPETAPPEATPPETGAELVTWQELPMPHLRVPVVHVGAPSARSVIARAQWTARTIASAVPQPKRLLYYGGVGALAALGILEWPVAATVAVGVWVATHNGQRGEGQRGERRSQAESPAGAVSKAARPAPATLR
jgi:hypothetical protein